MSLPQRNASGGMRRRSGGTIARAAAGTACCCNKCTYCTGGSTNVPSDYDVVFTGITKCNPGDGTRITAANPDNVNSSWSGLLYTYSTTGGGGLGFPDPTCVWDKTANLGTFDHTVVVEFGSGATHRAIVNLHRGGATVVLGIAEDPFAGNCDVTLTAPNTITLISQCTDLIDGYGGTGVATPVLPP